MDELIHALDRWQTVSQTFGMSNAKLQRGKGGVGSVDAGEGLKDHASFYLLVIYVSL